MNFEWKEAALLTVWHRLRECFFRKAEVCSNVMWFVEIRYLTIPHTLLVLFCVFFVLSPASTSRLFFLLFFFLFLFYFLFFPIFCFPFLFCFSSVFSCFLFFFLWLVCDVLFRAMYVWQIHSLLYNILTSFCDACAYFAMLFACFFSVSQLVWPRKEPVCL